MKDKLSEWKHLFSRDEIFIQGVKKHIKNMPSKDYGIINLGIIA